ncbi:SDR family NAD(P)-dependent oxidoreductase [Bradyrhizobium cenepequi]|uniref:SDR family NAD(P)-dependent oxidoreductase n=1 Tax=Bradyrhizobium cenepequi TaxID=2821403 RepID=UPI001CE2D8B6|nr:SDR family NAD(P)-dependent oxidoreductase [Bradyrhizobium cenepequi]MCA6111194.1 SDR family NAD(P)-dependent oxidoreductase [Bradyrhizobium cenepequi]
MSAVVLVTGANKGLGKEVVRQLGQRGLVTLLGSRDADRGEAAAAELRAEGIDVERVAVDVTSDESVAAAAAHIGRTRGHLDVLINNAGILRRIPTLETTVDNMRETYETNVFGVVRMIEHMMPLLARSAAPRIVNIASTSASLTLTDDPSTLFGQSDTIVAYASSKTALLMMTQHYANAFQRSEAHQHFRINSVTPGHIATDLNGHAGTRTVEQGARVVVEFATIADDGPSGGFFNEDGPLPW